MPRYAEPPASMPGAVRAVADALALSPVRLAIVREIMRADGGLTAAVLQENTSTSRDTLLRHLRGLEAAGLISAGASQQRAGHHLVYRADRAAVSAALEQLRRYASGEA